MVKVFYSGAKEPNSEQTNPIYSLGGYVSSSGFQNSNLNNLFQDLSNLSLQNNKKEYSCIILQNDSDTPISNLTLFFDLEEGNKCDFEIGFALPSEDSCNNKIFELLPNCNSKPIYVDQFYSPNSFEEAVVIPSFLENSYIGLFISRLVKPTTIDEQNINLESVEEISLNIMW